MRKNTAPAPFLDLDDNIFANIRGRITKNAPLGEKTWFATGGGCDILFKPKDMADLQEFIRAAPHDMPITCVGAGSNIIVRDGGVRGAVIRLTGSFNDINYNKDANEIICGAGVLDKNLSLFARDNCIGGMAFLYGIPGSIGGAIKMNAGANGREIKDILKYCHIVDDKGDRHILSRDDLQYGYRSSGLKDGWIVTDACFHAETGEKNIIQQQMQDVRLHREASQPLRGRTGGSSFKNPEGKAEGGKKAWQLVDEAGMRGFRIGGAHMSEKHCNFMINDLNATASDLENLGDMVQTQVLKKTGVRLEWEIKRLGDK